MSTMNRFNELVIDTQPFNGTHPDDEIHQGGLIPGLLHQHDNLKSEFDQRTERVFLRVYAETQAFYKSCYAANIAPDVVEEYIRQNPEFKKRMGWAVQEFRESVMLEVQRRALTGWREPTRWDNGTYDEEGNMIESPRPVAWVTKYSDRMLELLAKKVDPELRAANSGPGGTTVNVQNNVGSQDPMLESKIEQQKLPAPDKLTDQQADKMADLLESIVSEQ